MPERKIYNSPSTKNASTPVKKILQDCDNKLSVFLNQLNVNLKYRDRKNNTDKEGSNKYDDVYRGVENIKF